MQLALRLLSVFDHAELPSWSDTMNQSSLLKMVMAKSVKVPDAVKEGIFNYLVGHEGRLGGGCISSLYNNGALAGDNAEEFADACRLGSHTERVLVWHIATCLCEGQNDHRVASCLSRY